MSAWNFERTPLTRSRSTCQPPKSTLAKGKFCMRAALVSQQVSVAQRRWRCIYRRPAPGCECQNVRLLCGQLQPLGIDSGHVLHTTALLPSRSVRRYRRQLRQISPGWHETQPDTEQARTVRERMPVDLANAECNTTDFGTHVFDTHVHVQVIEDQRAVDFRLVESDTVLLFLSA